MKRYFIHQLEQEKNDRLLNETHLKAMTRDVCQQRNVELTDEQPKDAQEAIDLLNALGDFIVIDLMTEGNKLKIGALSNAIRNDRVTPEELKPLRIRFKNELFTPAMTTSVN